MTFEKINLDTDCKCLTKAVVDTENTYVRKLRKLNILNEKDFLTHWEREIRPETEDCETICSYKGVSINQFKPEYENQIIEKYKTTFNINPKKGAYLLKFRLTDEAGNVKYAPEDNDESHYNFFKSDDFTYDKIQVIETVKFA